VNISAIYESFLEFIQSNDSIFVVLFITALVFFFAIYGLTIISIKKKLINNKFVLLAISVFISFSFYFLGLLFDSLVRNFKISLLNKILLSFLLFATCILILTYIKNQDYFKTRLFKILFPFLLTCFSGCYIFVMSFFVWEKVSQYYPNRKFNLERWLEKPNKRYEMFGDVLPQLVGKSIGQIKEILIDGVNVSPDSSCIYIDIGIKPPIGWGAQSSQWYGKVENGVLSN